VPRPSGFFSGFGKRTAASSGRFFRGPIKPSARSHSRPHPFYSHQSKHFQAVIYVFVTNRFSASFSRWTCTATHSFRRNVLKNGVTTATSGERLNYSVCNRPPAARRCPSSANPAPMHTRGRASPKGSTRTSDAALSNRIVAPPLWVNRSTPAPEKPRVHGLTHAIMKTVCARRIRFRHSKPPRARPNSHRPGGTNARIDFLDPMSVREAAGISAARARRHHVPIPAAMPLHVRIFAPTDTLATINASPSFIRR